MHRSSAIFYASARYFFCLSSRALSATAAERMDVVAGEGVKYDGSWGLRALHIVNESEIKRLHGLWNMKGRKFATKIEDADNSRPDHTHTIKVSTNNKISAMPSTASPHVPQNPNIAAFYYVSVNVNSIYAGFIVLWLFLHNCRRSIDVRSRRLSAFSVW